MTRKTYVEVVCDGCGCAEHFLHPTTNEQIAADGYIVEGRKHFCSERCKAKLATEKAKAKAKAHRAN